MQEVVSTCLSNIIGREKNHTVCPQLEQALHTHNTKQQVFPATIKSCVIKDEILTNNIILFQKTVHLTQQFTNTQHTKCGGIICLRIMKFSKHTFLVAYDQIRYVCRHLRPISSTNNRGRVLPTQPTTPPFPPPHFSKTAAAATTLPLVYQMMTSQCPPQVNSDKGGY